MKVIKSILIAVVLGIVYVGIGLMKIDNIKMSEILLANTMSGVEFNPQYISTFSFEYIPIFVFQILFATNIYKHFCSASIYFFSRNANRIKWYLKEVTNIYLNSIIFLTVICISEKLFIYMFTTIKIDDGAVIIAIYYIAIYSIYLLSTTLAINIVSILFGSNIGFAIVQGIVLLSVSIFFILGNYVKDNFITEKVKFLIKGNLIANLIFPFHSSKINSINNLINIKSIDFDLNYSILYYLIICIVVIVFGGYVVEKYEFIINNKEMELKGKKMKLLVKNISKHIGKKEILKDISIELESGKVYGFVGKNGSGKTMLFRALSGLMDISSGKIFLDNKELHKDMRVLENVGIVIENAGLYPELTGFNNLKMLSKLNKKIDDEQIRKTIVRVGLNPNDKRSFKKYSLGMKQRIVIAQAIMEKPDILMLDEPTNALDEEGIEQIRKIIKEERERGAIVLIASHNKEDIEVLADKVFSISNGMLKESEE